MNSPIEMSKRSRITSLVSKRAPHAVQYWLLITVALCCLAYQFYLLEQWSGREIGIEFVTVVTTTMALVNCSLAIVVHGYLISFLGAYIVYSFLSLFSMAILFLWYGEMVFGLWFHIRFIYTSQDLHYVGNFLIVNSMAMSCLALGVCIPFKSALEVAIIPLFTSRLPALWYRHTCKILAVLSFIIGLSLSLYASYEGRGIELFLLKGYGFGYTHGHRALAYGFGFFFFWSFLYGLFSVSSRKQLIRLTPALLGLALLPLVIGDRAGAGKCIICLMLAYSSMTARRLGVRWTTLVVVLFFGTFSIPFVEQARQDTRVYLELFQIGTPGKSSERLKSVYNHQERGYKNPHAVISSPLAKLLRSFCFPSVVGPVVLLNVPHFEDYQYGKGYLSTFKRAIPFTSEYFDELFPEIAKADPHAWISKYNKTRAGTGFLQVYEAYLEFGLIGVLVSNILIGFLLSKMWIIYRANRGNPSISFYIMLIFTGFLNCVRGTSNELLLCILWGYALAYIVPLAFSLLFPIGRPEVRKVPS